MADTQQEQERQQQIQPGQDVRPQSQFDSIFGEQVFGTDTQSRDVAQAYWDLAEQTLRTARRIGETYALSMMEKSIVDKAAAKVLSHLQANPQLVQQRSVLSGGGQRQ